MKSETSLREIQMEWKERVMKLRGARNLGEALAHEQRRDCGEVSLDALTESNRFAKLKTYAGQFSPSLREEILSSFRDGVEYGAENWF